MSRYVPDDYPGDSLPPARVVRPPHRTNTRLLALAALVILLALAVGAIAVVLALPGKAATVVLALPGKAATAPVAGGKTPGAAFTPTGTPTLHGTWRSVLNGGAQRVAFAAGSPATGFACGSTDADAVPAPPPTATVVVYRTHDGGATWDNGAAHWPGNGCTISVNPTNPQDVVVEVDSCRVECQPTDTLYRSRNGGQTWAKLALPAANEQADGVLAWAGNTLFVRAGGSSSGQAAHELAVSVNGGALAWSGPGLTFGGVTGVIQQLTGVGKTMLLGIAPDVPTGGTSGHWTFVRSGDNGATWTTLTTLGDDAHFITPQGVGANGAALFGTRADGTLWQSTDTGATWRQLPAPDGRGTVFFMGQTPDGTLVIDDFLSANSETVDVLPPGATSWQDALDASNVSGGLLAVTWNAAGHLTALWGDFNATSGTAGESIAVATLVTA